MPQQSPTDSHPFDATHPAADFPAPPAPLRLRVTSEPANLARVRKAVEAYAAAAGFDESAVGEIGLVVNEAMANVIRHAYASQPGKPIEFEAEPTAGGSALQMRLRDWGSGVNPLKKLVREYTPGVPGGLGLVCLSHLMDGAEYAPQPDGGMLLTMTRSKRDGSR